MAAPLGEVGTIGADDCKAFGMGSARAPRLEPTARDRHCAFQLATPS